MHRLEEVEARGEGGVGGLHDQEQQWVDDGDQTQDPEAHRSEDLAGTGGWHGGTSLDARQQAPQDDADGSDEE